MKLNVDYVNTLPVLIECKNCGYKQVWFEYHYEAYRRIQSFYDRVGKCHKCDKPGTMEVSALKREIAEKLKDVFPDKKAPEFYERIKDLIKNKDKKGVK